MQLLFHILHQLFSSKWTYVQRQEQVFLTYQRHLTKWDSVKDALQILDFQHDCIPGNEVTNRTRGRMERRLWQKAEA